MQQQKQVGGSSYFQGCQISLILYFDCYHIIWDYFDNHVTRKSSTKTLNPIFGSNSSMVKKRWRRQAAACLRCGLMLNCLTHSLAVIFSFQMRFNAKRWDGGNPVSNIGREKIVPVEKILQVRTLFFVKFDWLLIAKIMHVCLNITCMLCRLVLCQSVTHAATWNSRQETRKRREKA